MERSKCWPSLGPSGKPEAASASSALPGVNVEGGWRSVESGSHSLAEVQEEAPVRKERAHQSVWPGCLPAPTPPAGPPWKTVNVYLSHLEVPVAFSSRMSAFCRGYWGRGTPCGQRGTRQQSHWSGEAENVLGPSDWGPGCLVSLAVYCLWSQAEDRKLVPWSNRPRLCCSHRTPRGRCALRDQAGDRLEPRPPRSASPPRTGSFCPLLGGQSPA